MSDQLLDDLGIHRDLVGLKQERREHARQELVVAAWDLLRYGERGPRGLVLRLIVRMFGRYSNAR